MVEDKKALRQTFTKIRNALSEERKKEASHAAFSLLSGLLKNKNVLSFASTNKEIDLWEINRWLLSQGTLFLPKVEGHALTIYKVSSLDNLQLSGLSILEPDEELSEVSDLHDIDVLLVPGLCFDRNNHRLGYGKGHYDRLLVHSHSPKWGIGYKEQLFDGLLPIEDHDQKLSQVLLL